MTRMHVRTGAALLLALSGTVALVGCAQDVGNNTQDSAGEGTTMVSAADLAGTWTSDEQGNPTLTFDESGSIEGTDGCNGIGTQYTIDGDTVRVDTFASTLMACPGVDDWLRGIREVQLDGDTMNVMNEAGEQIGTLQRATDSQ